MKKFAAILFWISLALLWIVGGTPASMYGYDATGMAQPRPEGINTLTEQAFMVLKEATSLYELPVQVRIPATERTTQGMRFTPAIQFSDFPAACICNLPLFASGNLLPPQRLSVERSIDYYIYTLRKIVI